MQIKIMEHSAAETIISEIAAAVVEQTAPACGAADQSDTNAGTMPTTKPDSVTLDEYRAVRREYARQHPQKPPTEAERERKREYQRRYRARHPEKVRQWQREWRQRNPDRVQMHQRTFWQRKAAELKQRTEPLTAEV